MLELLFVLLKTVLFMVALVVLVAYEVIGRELELFVKLLTDELNEAVWLQ